MGHPVAELVAQIDDPVVRRAAVGAGVASIFDQRDRRVGRPENMILGGIERRIEPWTNRRRRQTVSPAMRLLIEPTFAGAFPC
jgi:hypothetical protein